MLINHASKQVTAKVVYYGPGLSGKTTNLQYIFSITNPSARGELISMETEQERTLFFDLLPMNVGLIKGYQTHFQLYTVPGQVFYDSTRKLVLKGADGIVFVADSQELMEQANLESLDNMIENMQFNKLNYVTTPLVFQYNKRDLKNLSPIEKLNKTLNHLQRPYYESIACQGKGTIETLQEISAQILVKIKEALDHNELISKVPVDFDIDRQQEIIKKEDLPLKKISIEKIEEDENRGTLMEEKKIPPETKKAAEAEQRKTRAKEGFLSQYEDRTRITKIEKLKTDQNIVNIQVLDQAGNKLLSYDIEVYPETKKINLIFDVQK